MMRLSLEPTETNPYVVPEIFRELVNEAGVDQADIAIEGPMTCTWRYIYDIWVAEFPNVVYTGKFSTNFSRTLIVPTTKYILCYSDKTQKDKLYDVIEKAEYRGWFVRWRFERDKGPGQIL